jgi:hypothetical protein
LWQDQNKSMASDCISSRPRDDAAGLVLTR